MGALLAAFGSWFTSIAVSLLTGVSKRAFAYAYIGAFSLMTVVFVNTLNGLIPSLISSSPSNSLIQAGLQLLPSNTGACVAVIGTAHLARWVFVWQAKFIKSWMLP